MANKIFNSDLPKKCAYCAFARKVSDNNEIYCVKSGVVGENDFCKKYVYDATKRIPLKPTLNKDYSYKDFSL